MATVRTTIELRLVRDLDRDENYQGLDEAEIQDTEEENAEESIMFGLEEGLATYSVTTEIID